LVLMMTEINDRPSLATFQNPVDIALEASEHFSS
jgi:hypothetical protein